MVVWTVSEVKLNVLAVSAILAPHLMAPAVWARSLVVNSWPTGLLPLISRNDLRCDIIRCWSKRVAEKKRVKFDFSTFCIQTFEWVLYVGSCTPSGEVVSNLRSKSSSEAEHLSCQALFTFSICLASLSLLSPQQPCHRSSRVIPSAIWRMVPLKASDHPRLPTKDWLHGIKRLLSLQSPKVRNLHMF